MSWPADYAMAGRASATLRIGCDAPARCMHIARVCCYYAGMSVAITIRNVPQPVRDELAARAASTGRSLQEYLLAQLGVMAAHPPAEQVIERARSRVEAAGSRVTVDEILNARDADRR